MKRNGFPCLSDQATGLSTPWKLREIKPKLLEAKLELSVTPIMPLPEAFRNARVPPVIVYDRVLGSDEKPGWIGPVSRSVRFPRGAWIDIVPVAMPWAMKPVVWTCAVSLVWPRGVIRPTVATRYVAPTSGRPALTKYPPRTVPRSTIA